MKLDWKTIAKILVIYNRIQKIDMTNRETVEIAMRINSILKKGKDEEG
jgi:hypothetical protein